MLASAV